MSVRLRPRARPATIVALCAVLMVTAAAPAGAVAHATGRPAGPGSKVKAGKLGIGDSVMLGAASRLRARGIRVNAAVSRQFSAGAQLVATLAASGKLPRTVVIHLGNNGYLERADCDRIVRAAGKHRRVFLVTLKVPRGWRAVNNRRLCTCARAHATAHLIGWYDVSKGHPSWFASDGYHLTAAGARAYARLIAGRL
jgi:hypothetical protein